jgi:hypothetical protein
MNRKLSLSFTGWAVIVFITLIVITVPGVAIWPVFTAPIRILIAMTALSGFMVAVCLAIRLSRRGRRTRIAAAAVLAALCLWSALASRSPQPDGLRQAYLVQLRSYLGTPYVWGGETGRGIDCSGLARVAFWQATLNYGARTGNPRLLGPGLWRFWWRDMSAMSMRAQSYGYMRRIGAASELAGCDTSDLKVGDVAVTEGGVHVLIYTGSGRWIEASPEDMKVTENPATAGSRRAYFRMPVTFLRWWLLDER